MPLFVKEEIRREYNKIPKNASRFNIWVQDVYLGEAYDLNDGDQIKGEILELHDRFKQYPDLAGEKITLIMTRTIIYDKLFISKDDWERLLRERGMVTTGYTLQLKLTEATRVSTGESMKLFTQKDLVLYTR